MSGIRQTFKAVGNLSFLPLLAAVLLNAMIISPLAVAQEVTNCMHAEGIDSLISKAETQGRVRIVVSLLMDFTPEGQLPDSQAINKQRARIAALQDIVLQRLAHFPAASIKRYRFTPALAMDVDADTLRLLVCLGEVASIAEDVALPPLAPR